jgi:hypothetical protein
MHVDRVLQETEIGEGVATSGELRRFFVLHAVKLAALGLVCGLLPVAAGLFAGAPVQSWAVLLPVGLALLFAFSPARNALHFHRLHSQFLAALGRAKAGESVSSADIPALARQDRPNNSLKRTNQSLRD